MPLETAGPAGISQRNAEFKFKKSLFVRFCAQEMPGPSGLFGVDGRGRIKMRQAMKNIRCLYTADVPFYNKTIE